MHIPRHAIGGHMRSIRHKANTWSPMEGNICVMKTAFKSRIITYKISSNNHHINVENFLNEIKNKVLPLIENEVRKHVSIKLNLELFGMYYLDSKENHEMKSFNTRNEIVSMSSDLDHLYDDFVAKLDEKADIFQERDSGTL